MPALLTSPDIVDDVRRREFLGILAAAGLLSACGNDDPAPSAGAATRTVRHAFGTTEVPTAPQRVVAALGQDDLELLLALGVVPVGAGNSPGFGYDPWAPWLDVPGEVGAVPWSGDGPSVESLAALRPDLIVGPANGRMQELYDDYAALAPTIAVAPDIDARPWQEKLQFLATALGREDEGARVLADSEAALADLRERSGDLRGRSVSFVIPSPGDAVFLLYLRGGGVSILLDEVGMVLNDPATALADDNPTETRAEVSTERYGDVAADLVLCSAFDEAQLEACQTDVFDNPLIAASPEGEPVQEVSVGFHWLAGGSPQQDLAVIADIERLATSS